MKLRYTYASCWIGVLVLLIVTLIMAWQAPGRSMSEQSARAHLDEAEKMIQGDDIYGAATHLQSVLDNCRQTSPSAYFEAAVMMANVYSLVNEYDQIGKLLDSLEYREDSKPTSFAPQYYYRLKALIEVKERKNFTLASTMNDSAIAVAQRLYPDRPYYQSIDIANQAETYFYGQHYEEAWEQIHRLEQDPLISRHISFSSVLSVKAMLFYHECAYDSAYNYARRGYQKSEEYMAVDNQLICLNLLCQIDSIRNDLTSYIHHHRLYDLCLQHYTTAEVESHRAISQATAAAESRHKQAQYRWRLSLLLSALLALAVVGLIIIIVVMRRQVKDNRRIAALEKQSIEEEILRSHLQNELLSMQLADKERSLKDAKQDNLLLGSRLAEHEGQEAGTKLENLEHMLNVHCLEFMAEIVRLHPTLTSNEVRLLGFIRMGIKPSIVSSALNISPTSLNTARYRIRKKLSLSSEQDLREYLLSI